MELVAGLLVAGVLLLLLETILPGLVAGIVGMLCIIIAVFLTYSRYGLYAGNVLLFSVLLLSIVGTMLWLKYFPTSAMARPLISKRTIGNVGAEQPDLLHQTGTAFTPLRPSGTAVINGRRVDVVSEGSLIERGTPLKVVAIEGMRVVVRPL